jgi:hypothetical protein
MRSFSYQFLEFKFVSHNDLLIYSTTCTLNIFCVDFAKLLVALFDKTHHMLFSLNDTFNRQLLRPND